jgi:hypothetical protein
VAVRSAGQKQQSPWKLEQEKDQVRSKIKKDFDHLVTCWSLWKNMNVWVFAKERNNGLYRGVESMQHSTPSFGGTLFYFGTDGGTLE